MNNLNSVLLEGKVVDDPKYWTLKAEIVKELEERYNSCNCSFIMESNGFYKQKKGIFQEEISQFEIRFFGETGDFFKATLKKGKCVRVIGRLKQVNIDVDDNLKVIVIANLVEFKPKK